MDKTDFRKKGGRPISGTDAQVAMAKSLWHDNRLSNDDICKISQMNYRTLYRRLGKRYIKTGRKIYDTSAESGKYNVKEEFENTHNPQPYPKIYKEIKFTCNYNDFSEEFYIIVWGYYEKNIRLWKWILSDLNKPLPYIKRYPSIAQDVLK